MRLKPTFVSKNAFVLGVVSLLNDAAGGIIVSLLPLLGIPASGIGFIEGVADGFSNISKGFIGFAEDRAKHKKRIAVLGYSISVSTRLLFLISQTFPFVFGLRLLDRTGKAVREPARDALLANSSETHNVGKSFGLQRAMDTIGGIIGPFVATVILIIYPQNFTLLFILAFLFGLAALSQFFFVTDDGTRVTLRTVRITSGKYKAFLLFSFLFSLGNLPIALLLIRVHEITNQAFLVPLMFLSFNVFYAVFLFYGGVLGDKYHNSKVIFGGILLGVVSLIIFAWADNLLTLWISFAVYGVFLGFTDTGMKAYVARHVEQNKFASSYGLFSSITGVGIMIAGAVGGSIWQIISPSFAVCIAATFLLLSGFLFIGVKIRYRN